MELTRSQQTILKADVVAKSISGGVFESFIQTGNTGQMANFYNELATPNVLVWKNAVSKSEIEDIMSWTVLILRSDGERDIYKILVSDRGASVNPSRINIRQAFQDIFSGVLGAGMRATLTTLFQTNASKIEILFGGLFSQGAIERVYVGPIHFSDIDKALVQG
jgi:hypothetical protein